MKRINELAMIRLQSLVTSQTSLQRQLNPLPTRRMEIREKRSIVDQGIQIQEWAILFHYLH